jgi:hypothetical protein
MAKKKFRKRDYRIREVLLDTKRFDIIGVYFSASKGRYTVGYKCYPNEEILSTTGSKLYVEKLLKQSKRKLNPYRVW